MKEHSLLNTGICIKLIDPHTLGCAPVTVLKPVVFICKMLNIMWLQSLWNWKNKCASCHCYVLCSNTNLGLFIQHTATFCIFCIVLFLNCSLPLHSVSTYYLHTYPAQHLSFHFVLFARCCLFPHPTHYQAWTLATAHTQFPLPHLGRTITLKSQNMASVSCLSVHWNKPPNVSRPWLR